MSVQTYAKRHIALRQIETAIRLFEEQDDLISVVTLAGAAEEILGKLLKRGGRTNSLESLNAAAHAMYQYLFGGEPLPPSHFVNRANLARNAFKHLHTAAGDEVTLDLRDEAVDMLTRAIDNYWYLETNLTPAMERFCRAQRFTESASDL